MSHRVGLGFIAALSAFFGGYGLEELARAYRAITLDEWRARALPGAGGVILGVVLAVTTWQTLG
jgi:hypothetical protein